MDGWVGGWVAHKETEWVVFYGTCVAVHVAPVLSAGSSSRHTLTQVVVDSMDRDSSLRGSSLLIQWLLIG